MSEASEAQTSNATVLINGLGGNTLELDMQSSDSIEHLRECVSSAWTLDPKAFRLLCGTSILEDKAEIKSIAPSDGSRIDVQLIKFDPLPDLGLFEQSNHTGISIATSDGKATLTKTSDSPDSNNVFLRHAIREPCFVEFAVVKTSDELSFGFTYDKNVERVSGFSNLYLKNTCLYSKQKSMPTFLVNGKSLPDEDATIEQGDRIALYADPENDRVQFYKNGVAVGRAFSFPSYSGSSRSESPLWIYVMVDFTADEVSVLRFGPGEPY